jgi:hypothetical protein
MDPQLHKVKNSGCNTLTQTKENHDADSYTKHEKVTRLTNGFPAVEISRSFKQN